MKIAPDLYVIAKRDKNGNYIEFLHNGRNGKVAGYDTLESAKRSKNLYKNIAEKEDYELVILKVTDLFVIE